MRVVIKGNVGKRVSWFKEHEFEIWCSLCWLVGMAVFALALL